MVTVLESNKATTNQTLLWLRQFGLGRKRILDTHLAAALYIAGVRRLLTSNPGDFAIFTDLKIVIP